MEPFTEFAFTVASATTLVVGLVWVLGGLGLPSHWKPVAAILIGTAATVFLSNLALKEAVFSGIMLGLTASGAYSGGKAITERIREN